MPTITANCDTALTSTPLQSSDPKVGYVFNIKAGTALKVDHNSLSQDINKKAKARFKPHLTLRGDQWTELFLFMEHWDGVDEILRSKVATAIPFSAAGSDRLILPITYRSQVDNSNQTGQGEGWRQCALTSIIMFLEAVKGLAWLTQQSAGFKQPEDWYAAKLTAHGLDTTDPQAHAWMLREIFGIPVKFRYDLTLQDAKETLDRALGMVCGVRYKVDGHYQYLAGKHLTKGGLIYKDPYGDRIITDSTALDSYLTIGSGGDNVYWPIPVVKDAWLDLGDRAGWGLWPEPSVYGFNFQKPAIEFKAGDSRDSTSAAVSPRKITQSDIDRAAQEMGIEPRILSAVIKVEVGETVDGFLRSGRPKILFEAQWFGYYTDDQYNDSHPDISAIAWDKSLYKGGEAEWDRLERAAKLDQDAAYMSASWGIGQIMGFHWSALGYKSVLDFANKMGQSEGEQLLAMARFIKSDPAMIRALKNKAWADFAYKYNGEGYKANAYDTKLAQAYAG